MDKPTLPISGLSDRHNGISPGLSESYNEAARVCLDRHHASPVEFMICDSVSVESIVEWVAADERLQKAWANTIDTTESGAYCLALAAVELARGFVAVRRAETHTGADYYLAPAGEDYEDLEQSHRLEVSGVDKGGDNILQTRLRQKVAQAASGRSSLPAIAAVVGFSERKILFANVMQT